MGNMYIDALAKVLTAVVDIDDETLGWLLFWARLFLAGDECALPRDFVEYLHEELNYMTGVRWDE